MHVLRPDLSSFFQWLQARAREQDELGNGGNLSQRKGQFKSMSRLCFPRGSQRLAVFAQMMLVAGKCELLDSATADCEMLL